MNSKLRFLTLGAVLLAIGITLVRGRTRGRSLVFKRQTLYYCFNTLWRPEIRVAFAPIHLSGSVAHRDGLRRIAAHRRSS